MIVRKVQKWGNSQGLRLPQQLLNLADIGIGDEVELQATNSQITVKKVARPKYVLADLVERIPQDYQSVEINFGPACGREAW